MRTWYEHALAAALLSIIAAPAIADGGDLSAATPRSTVEFNDAPAALERLIIETGWPAQQPLALRGADAEAQLLATGIIAGGGVRDVTREVRFEALPGHVVAVNDAGRLTPLADGVATIAAATADGLSASIEVVVTCMHDDRQVNFANQVVPIFTRHECNSGGCHGKLAGQNGFRLSLLGFEPTEDFEFLVKEGRGRRLSPAAPERSLLVQKASGLVPHAGGERLLPQSYEYRLLCRWIAQGMPYGSADDPRIARLELFPRERTMARRGQQQLVALAHYTDGTIEDVTRLAQYEPNDSEMADVSSSSLVTVRDLSGDVAIMARYQGHVAVFRATVPLGAAIQSTPPVRNFIDELVFGKLESLGVSPSPLCDDATFVRRATLDIAGRLPTADEAREFLKDARANKRELLVDRLLDGADYAQFFAGKWSAILRNKRTAEGDIHGTFLFRDWIRAALYENEPYDQFVREILTATGDLRDNPPVAWFRSVADTEQRVEDAAQLFLGQRIQCARCHHHPFEKWSQRDYYSLAAFFSRVGQKEGNIPEEDRIYHKRGAAVAKHPRTNESLLPAGLGVLPLMVAYDDDPRHALVDWMAADDNPYFAPALVNRYWKHFFSRGLVDPEDDMRVTNPASNPALLSALAAHFVDRRFDLKDLIRTICNASTYQLSSIPNEHNADDRKNFARYYPKRLTAEVLLDAIDVTLGAQTPFEGLPRGTRAVELPDDAVPSYFLTVFGKPSNSSACECERSVDASLAQTLHLLNSVEIQEKLADAAGRASSLAADKQTLDDANVRTAYLTALAREPSRDELNAALSHLAAANDRKAAYEDLLWALVNTKEFLFNH